MVPEGSPGVDFIVKPVARIIYASGPFTAFFNDPVIPNPILMFRGVMLFDKPCDQF